MAVPDEKLPWFKFFPSDWLGDSHLQATRAATRGIWANLISHMKRRGVGELEVTLEKLMQLGGCTELEAIGFLSDMADEEAADVFYLNGEQRIPIPRRSEVTVNSYRFYLIVSRRLSREVRKKKNDRERQDRKRSAGGSPESRQEITHDVTAEVERLHVRERSEIRDQRSEEEEKTARAPAHVGKTPLAMLLSLWGKATGEYQVDHWQLTQIDERLRSYGQAQSKSREEVLEKALAAFREEVAGWATPRPLTAGLFLKKWGEIQGRMAGTVPAASQRPSARNGRVVPEPPKMRVVGTREEELAELERNQERLNRLREERGE